MNDLNDHADLTKVMFKTGANKAGALALSLRIASATIQILGVYLARIGLRMLDLGDKLWVMQLDSEELLSFDDIFNQLMVMKNREDEV